MQDNILTTKLNDSIYNFSRLMKEGAMRYLGASKLTLIQFKALIFIEKKENIKMRDIAEHFHVETPTATSLVSKLCSAGLVERKAVKSDRRIVLISLTTEGKTLLKKAKTDYSRRISKLLSYLNNSEKQNFLNILEKLNKKLIESYEK